MMRSAFIFASFLAPLFFPWPLAAALALIAGFFVPLAPLAIGLFADTLYFSHNAYSFPFFTLAGLIVSIAAFYLRRFLETSLMHA